MREIVHGWRFHPPLDRTSIGGGPGRSGGGIRPCVQRNIGARLRSERVWEEQPMPTEWGLPPRNCFRRPYRMTMTNPMKEIPLKKDKKIV